MNPRRGNYAGCNPQVIGDEKDAEILRLHTALLKIFDMTYEGDPVREIALAAIEGQK